jgi:hypothetical protein
MSPPNLCDGTQVTEAGIVAKATEMTGRLQTPLIMDPARHILVIVPLAQLGIIRSTRNHFFSAVALRRETARTENFKVKNTQDASKFYFIFHMA